MNKLCVLLFSVLLILSSCGGKEEFDIKYIDLTFGHRMGSGTYTNFLSNDTIILEEFCSRASCGIQDSPYFLDSLTIIEMSKILNKPNRSLELDPSFYDLVKGFVIISIKTGHEKHDVYFMLLGYPEINAFFNEALTKIDDITNIQDRTIVRDIFTSYIDK